MEDSKQKEGYTSNTATGEQVDQPPQGNDEIERIRREAEEARRREEELRELVRLSLQQQQYSSTAPPESPYGGQQQDDFEIPDGFDPEDPKQLAKVVRELAKREAEKMARQLADSYSSDRARQVQAIATAQFNSFYQRLAAAGREDLANKVSEYIRQNNIPADNLLTPDAYESIAAYIVGQEVYQQQIASPRPPNLASNGRLPDSSPSRPSIPDEEIHRFRSMVHYGDEVDVEELARIVEKGEMTSEDYAKIAAKGGN